MKFPYLVQKKLKAGQEVRRVTQLDWQIIENDCTKPFVASGLEFIPLPVSFLLYIVLVVLYLLFSFILSSMLVFWSRWCMGKTMYAWAFFLVESIELHIYLMFHAFFQVQSLVSIFLYALQDVIFHISCSSVWTKKCLTKIQYGEKEI